MGTNQMIHNIIHGMYEGNFSFLILVIGTLDFVVGILQIYLLVRKGNK